MKAASIKELKLELSTRSQKELTELCMRLSKYKKENKELLTYLLFEESDEAAYIKNVKSEIKDEFKLINTASYFYIKKTVRKILRNVKKYIKYSKKKETEVELLMYFCTEFKSTVPYIEKNITLDNIYRRQIENIKKAISFLHEDLQYDYNQELKVLL
ncbi:MAG: hypothetical protein CVU00_08755 [Bacteroidetes bacterium HGW-Bacteroidetes-17]|jgi:hypothetical protein|nr:MAG: hypothetical protein CVU00_08755 [Bacteroidetes bacterium HGW-Bacteroidetes-17]